MPSKVVKLRSGRVLTVKAVRLANGSLLVPARGADDRDRVEWREVAPGSSEYKRWLPVAVDEPDPRTA